MEKRNSFFDIIHPSHLYFCALVFLAITFLLVLTIYVVLYVKKRRFRKEQKVIQVLDEWIGEAIMATEDESHIYVTHELLDYFEAADMRQLAIDRLIETKKNLTGTSADNIIKLYVQLGLREDSLNKIASMVWHVKAKGIYELYMMNQEDYKEEIRRYTNSENQYVRTEAQTAMLNFEGFEGLKFLDTLKYIINDWQQVKLLEQLESRDTQNMGHLPLWLGSDNPYVRYFALKLADIYQQMEMHDEVAHCLRDDSEKIRYQAIKTLGTISNETTNHILREHYHTETVGNKRKILKQFLKIGTPADKSFLLEQAKTTTGIIRLEAIRALAMCCPQDWDELLKGEGTDMDAIIEQVQYELAA